MQSVSDILRACAREEAHARLALSTPRKSTQLLKQACGEFAARHFELVLCYPRPRSRSQCMVPIAALRVRAQVHRVESFSLLPTPLQVWLFSQRSAHPMHCFAYGQSFMAPQVEPPRPSEPPRHRLTTALVVRRSCSRLCSRPLSVAKSMPARHLAPRVACLRVLRQCRRADPPLACMRTHCTACCDTAPSLLVLPIQDEQLSIAAKWQVALSRHNWIICDLLLDAGASLQPLGGAMGGTLLHAAASAGDAQACSFLAQRGAALTTKDEDGKSPLDCAVLGEHAGAASALKERGASSSFVLDGNTLMHQLATEGSAIQLSILLGNSDVADLPNAHGYTALHLATLHGKLAAAELLLLAHADPNRMPAGGGPSPLHLAAKLLSPPLIGLLLKHSAHVQAKMAPTGETPLHLCSTERACCSLLIGEGALLEERDASGFTPLQAPSPLTAQPATTHGARKNVCCVSIAGREQALPHLVLAWRVWQHAVCGVAPLLPCRALLQAGARVNTVDYVQKQTPLHRLCDRGGGDAGGETLACLLEHGAAVNLQDRDGHTPLHIAAFRGQTELALALVSTGASPNVPSNEGLCALSRVPPTTIHGGKAVPARVQQQMLARIAQPPPWLPDQLAPNCQLCAAVFSASNRRCDAPCTRCLRQQLPPTYYGMLSSHRGASHPLLPCVAGTTVGIVGASLAAIALPTKVQSPSSACQSQRGCAWIAHRS